MTPPTTSDDPRARDVQIFSSPSDAPRVRWPTDLVSAGVSAALLVVLVVVAGDGSTLDTDTLQFIGTLPDWLLWVGQAAYFLGVLYALALLIGVGVVAHRRLELLRDMLLAALLGAALVVALSRLIDDRWPEFAFLDLQQTRDTFPAFSITAAVAIQAAAAPFLTKTIRTLGWTFIVAATIASVIGGVTTVSDALGGVLVGLMAAALVRWVLGTTAGLPSTDRVRRGLAGLGTQMDELAYLPEQSGAALALTGTSTDGAPRFVSVLGSDSWNSRLLARWWREAWYQDVGAQYGSDRRQQVEHESLAMVLGARNGASVPELVTVGMTADDDAVLVSTLYDHTLADVPDARIDDEMLASIWDRVRRLHDAGLSHGSIDALHIWFDSGGEVQLAGFSNAALHPTVAQQRTDLAATLVTTALPVGEDRAIDAARRALGDDLAVMLPLLQTASLNSRLRAELRQKKLNVTDLRKRTAQVLGIDAPEPEQLTRVSWKNVLAMVFVGFAAYTIIGGLADVGFDTIVDTLGDARWGLVLLALVLAAATNYTDAIALAKVSPKPVPVGITTAEQFAIGFVNIAVPSAAGRIATNARFFEKFGISAVTSSTSGAITGLLGFLAQAILLIVTILVGSGSIDLSNLQSDGDVLRFLGMAVVVFVGAAIVVAVVPKLRQWAANLLREPLSQLGAAFATLRQPRVASQALTAAAGTEILYGAAFAVCVLAMGGSISLGEAVFINVTVSLFAGLMPIPGGVGVTEAGLAAGLAAVGVPSDTAVGAVIVYRLVSYYLPPLWGYVSLRWLTSHDYL